MHYDIEHIHTIQVPETLIEWLKEELDEKYQTGHGDTIQIQYDEHNYLRLWC